MYHHSYHYLLYFFIFSIILAKPTHAEQIQTLDIKEFSAIISNNKNKVIVVNVFATWCPACRTEIPNIVKIYKEYIGKPVVFIGLSVDHNFQKLKNYIKEEQVNFPVYSAGKSITSMLRVSAIPHNIIYNKNGDIVLNSAGVMPEDELKKSIEQYLK